MSAEPLEREARHILRGVEGETLAGGARAPLPGNAAEADDWAERWGKRVGAVLGPLLAFAALLWFLFSVLPG